MQLDFMKLWVLYCFTTVFGRIFLCLYFIEVGASFITQIQIKRENHINIDWIINTKMSVHENTESDSDKQN